MSKSREPVPLQSAARVQSPTGRTPDPPPPEPQLLSDDFIGQALKAHFDNIASAPVPDKFLVLLAELEAKELKHDR